jgi:cyclic dehypoxanthinyl futalosine synthase
MRQNQIECIDNIKHVDLEFLKNQANEQRYKKNPAREVTFVLDSNPNYTNLCNADCTFCSFYRKEKHDDVYTKNVDEVMKHVEKAANAGLSTVLLQGGLHPSLPLSYYVELVQRTRAQYPTITPHFFSAPEIHNIACANGITIHDVLSALYDAGQCTLPGGGAEILAEKVRKKISRKKMTSQDWLDVHRTAHNIGYRSTATMMYGHVETAEDIVEHLTAIRDLQDETGGFTAFIPWSYKPEGNALGKRLKKRWAGPHSYYRILSTARIYLDNFDHVQASWFSEGKEVGVNALSYGADDFGGLIMEENVHKATSWINTTTVTGILQMIRKAGFTPVERNPLYKKLQSFENTQFVSLDSWQKTQSIEELSSGYDAVTKDNYWG